MSTEGHERLVEMAVDGIMLQIDLEVKKSGGIGQDPTVTLEYFVDNCVRNDIAIHTQYMGGAK